MSAPKKGKDYIRELEAQIRDITASREHFRRSAERQKSRCHKLRHRQRALISALENVKQSEEIEQAKLAAHIGIGGWSDEELVYQSRTMKAVAQADHEARVRAEIELAPDVAALVDAATPFCAAVFNDNGDVTISTGHLKAADWLKLDAAIRALKGAAT